MADNMDTEFALLKQTVNGHDEKISHIVRAVDKISESIQTISLVLQHQENQKETTARIFEEIKEIREDHKASAKDYWEAINNIRQDMPVLKLTSGWVKTAGIGFIGMTISMAVYAFVTLATK